jgi:hypothetical protein
VETEVIVSKAIEVILTQAGREAAKKLVSTVFSKNHDQFPQLAKRAALKLDKQYNHALFGGDMVNVLTAPEVLETLKQFLNPFDQPVKEDFPETIHWENLPTDFFEQMKMLVLSELYQAPAFNSSVIEMLHMIQQDNVYMEVTAIRQNQEEFYPEVLNQLIQLTEKTKAKQLASTPQRKKYSAPPEYIPRHLYPISELYEPYIQPKGTLAELLATQHRVIVASAAGMGKSTELLQLAYQYSIDHSKFPLMIQLNTYTGEKLEVLLKRECEGWRSINQSPLILIFDGLDEIHDNYREIFISRLFVFIKQFCDVSIVVACRDNFLNSILLSSEHKQFFVGKLKELSPWDVIVHARKKLGEKDGDVFIATLQQLNIFEIALSPFFMTFLLEAYQRDKALPVSKIDLFEKLIEHRIIKDHERFAAKGIRLDKRSEFIKQEIERLALIMEAAGRNYINEVEFQKLIPKYDDHRELIEHTFLFDKANQTTWQFDHNNFQEYLAAKGLSNKPLDKIKELIALPPDYKVIKPTWVNTLSFLFIQIDRSSGSFEGLLSWLIQTDPELLLRFEKDRVDLPIREDIFKRILHEYQDKGIVTRSEKFDVTDLANFVSDSIATLEFLLSRLKEATSTLVIGEICRMLPNFKSVQQARPEFKNLLESIIMAASTATEAKYYAMSALRALGWQNKESFETFFPTISMDGQYERAGVFRYLTDSGFQDDYVDLIIRISTDIEKHQVHVNSPPLRKEAILGDESINREACFLSIQSPDALSKVLKFLANTEDRGQFDSLGRNLLENGLLETVGRWICAGHRTLLDEVIELFLAITRYHQERAEQFTDFFNSIDTIEEVRSKVLQKGDSDNHTFYSLALLIDDQFANDLVTRYKNNELSDRQAIAIRGGLNWSHNRKVHDLFYEQINAVSGNKFLYINHGVDWAQIRKNRLQKDLALLQDREEFFRKIREIFTLEEKGILNEEDLWNFNKKHFSDENFFDNNLAIDVLRHDIPKPITLDKALAYFADQNWQSFQINKLVKFDSQNIAVLGEDEKNFVKSWCDRKMPEANFSTAIGETRYRYLEVYLAYWIKRFDFSYSDLIYLDLLWVNSNCMIYKIREEKEDEVHVDLGDWVVLKVGLEKVKKKILENFNTGIKNVSVLRHHLTLCWRHKIVEALPYIETILSKENLTSNDLADLCIKFIEMGGSISIVETILSSNTSLDRHDRNKLIESLIEHSSIWVLTYLESKLQEGDEEEKKTCAKYLMNSGRKKGLEYYSAWVRCNKTFDDFIGSKQFLAVPPDESAPLLLEMLEAYVQPGFDRDHLHAQDQDLLETLCRIGSEKKEHYLKVQEKFHELLKNYDAKILHYYLKRLELLFYTRETKILSLTDVAEHVDALLERTSR